MCFPGKLSGIRRAFDWLKEWFGKIREAVTGLDKYSDAARIQDKAERSVRDSLGQLFSEGMSQAVRTHELLGDMKDHAVSGISPLTAFSRPVFLQSFRIVYGMYRLIPYISCKFRIRDVRDYFHTGVMERSAIRCSGR